MHVSSVCPLRVASLVWQPRPEAFALTVICKATFTLRPGTSPLAPAQEKPWSTDIPRGDDLRASLWAVSDLVPFKRRVDVLAVGHAHAPSGEFATSLVARLAVGAVDKRIEVHGDRSWSSDGQITAAIPVTKVPLAWERASGGPGNWNPVGVPASAPPSTSGLRPIPNLLPPGTVIRSPTDLLPPVSFGPIAPSWPERATKLHRHAATFRHEAWAERPLPEDIDAGYFNAAPPDQQLDQLLPGERILLEHLHPQHSRLVTVLEEVIPHATLHHGEAEPQELRLRCDTLWIDTDRGLCTLTWRGAVPLRHPAEEVAVIVTAERPQAEDDVAETLVPLRAVADSAGLLPVTTAGTPALEANSGVADAPGTTTTLVPGEPATGPGGALPFEVRPVLPFAPVPVGAPDPTHRTPALSVLKAGEHPPRAIPAVPAVPVERPTFSAAGSLDDGTGTLAPSLVPVAVEPLPFQIAPTAVPLVATWAATPPPPAPAIPSLLTLQAAPETPPLLVEPEITAMEEQPRHLTPPPPPLLGPLVPTAQADTADEPATARRPSTAATTAAKLPTGRTSAPAASLLAPLTSAAPRLGTQSTFPGLAAGPADVSVERFASISAEIAEQRAPRAEVLLAHELSEGAWAAVERNFRTALDKDARASGRLRAVHDAAYVAAVERFRGPITLPEFARITLGLERGEANLALDALKIQRAALMPIVRVWTKKAASDRKLNMELMALLDRLRAE